MAAYFRGSVYRRDRVWVHCKSRSIATIALNCAKGLGRPKPLVPPPPPFRASLGADGHPQQLALPLLQVLEPSGHLAHRHRRHSRVPLSRRRRGPLHTQCGGADDGPVTEAGHEEPTAAVLDPGDIYMGGKRVREGGITRAGKFTRGDVTRGKAVQGYPPQNTPQPYVP